MFNTPIPIPRPLQPRPQTTTVTTTTTTVTTAANFISRHTIPDLFLALSSSCPICLDAYTAESCVRITGINGCEHAMGKKCLEELLRRDPGQEKKCPLCRATWVAAMQRHEFGGGGAVWDRRERDAQGEVRDGVERLFVGSGSGSGSGNDGGNGGLGISRLLRRSSLRHLTPRPTLVIPQESPLSSPRRSRYTPPASLAVVPDRGHVGNRLEEAFTFRQTTSRHAPLVPHESPLTFPRASSHAATPPLSAGFSAVPEESVAERHGGLREREASLLVREEIVTKREREMRMREEIVIKREREMRMREEAVEKREREVAAREESVDGIEWWRL